MQKNSTDLIEKRTRSVIIGYSYRLMNTELEYL